MLHIIQPSWGIWVQGKTALFVVRSICIQLYIFFFFSKEMYDYNQVIYVYKHYVFWQKYSWECELTKRLEMLPLTWIWLLWKNLCLNVDISLFPCHCARQSLPIHHYHFDISHCKLTLTLMILLLKVFSTTIMSSESAGESVPSWLQTT